MKMESESDALDAVKNGMALKCVPEALRTPELCAAAVRRCGLALQWVPETLKTPGLCAEAVAGSGWAVKFVPLKLLTKDLCLVAARDAGARVFELMSRRLVTRTVCDAVATADGTDPEAVWQDVCEWREAMPMQE